jgi:predicted extracellular nuclease
VALLGRWKDPSVNRSAKTALLLFVLACAAGAIVASCAIGPRQAERHPAPPRAVPAADAQAVPARPARVGETLRIAAWNIEWLGTPASRSGPAKGHAQSAADLAAYIAAARVDILGLEEIARDEPRDTWTNPTLDEAFAEVGRTHGGDWRHQLFPARSGRNQLTGIAWDATRVRAVGAPRCVVDAQRKSSQGDDLWPRPPYGQMFSAGDGLTDFVVVVVHLKSDYGGSFALKRAEEADALMAGLPRVFDDPDVVIIGDFNCTSHQEPAALRFLAAGFFDANGSDESTHWRYGPLDRVMIPADQPEFASRRFEVLRDAFLSDQQLSPEQFKVRLSDHFMVITEVTIGPDDD